MRWVRMTLIALTATIPVCAHTADYTGNDMLRDCESDNSFSRGVCMGYLDGVTDGVIKAEADQYLMAFMDAGQTGARPPELGHGAFCIPKGVTLGQLKQVVIKHLRDYPQFTHLNAGNLAVAAMGIAFPCARR